MIKYLCIAGKNAIAINALQYVIDHFKYNEIKLVACLCKGDKNKNDWQPSFGFYCKKNGIDVIKLEDCYDLKNLSFVSLQFDRILKPEKFKTAKLYNIHFSKLPANKGMYPAIVPLLKGETETGVTLHLIDDGIDTGEIVEQRIFPIDINMNSKDIYLKYLEEGLTLFKAQIDNILENKIVSKRQSPFGSSYFSASFIDFSSISIDLNKTAFEMHNQVRAFCFREFQLPVLFGKKIYRSEIIENKSGGKPGTLSYCDEWIMIINAIDYQVKLFIDKEDSLMHAGRAGDLNIYRLLCDNDYPVNIRSKEGWDILIIACYNNQVDFAKHLLEKGWDVNTCNYSGTTASMYAMTAAYTYNDLSILKLIISYAPDLYAKDDRGKTIFDYSNDTKNNEIIKYLNLFQ